MCGCGSKVVVEPQVNVQAVETTVNPLTAQVQSEPGLPVWDGNRLVNHQAKKNVVTVKTGFHLVKAS